jgi:hypothetical protein
MRHALVLRFEPENGLDRFCLRWDTLVDPELYQRGWVEEPAAKPRRRTLFWSSKSILLEGVHRDLGLKTRQRVVPNRPRLN